MKNPTQSSPAKARAAAKAKATRAKVPTELRPVNNTSLQMLAVSLALTCVRNTHLETLHAGPKGFSDADMRTLMREVVNKLYTALWNLQLASKRKRLQFLDALFCEARNELREWDVPERDEGIDGLIEYVAETRKAVRAGAISFGKTPEE